MIEFRTFEEWADGETDIDPKRAYEAGIKAAKDQWELDKIAIHEYYDKKIRELMGTKAPEPNEENHGRLT